MRLGQVLAVRPLALDQVRDRVEAEAVEAEVEPEAEDLEHRLLDLGVVEVQVRLVGVEAVPVIGPGLVVPRPVRALRVDEDDPCVLVLVHGVRPHVPVPLGAVGPRARLLEPRVLGRRVVHDEVGDDADAALVRLLDQLPHVLDDAVVLVDGEVVGDVVAAVAQRRGVEGQQPDAVHAEPLEIVQLLGEAAEVAGAVTVAVEEAADVDLVEDGRLEPQRLSLEPLAGIARAGRHSDSTCRTCA